MQEALHRDPIRGVVGRGSLPGSGTKTGEDLRENEL